MAVVTAAELRAQVGLLDTDTSQDVKLAKFADAAVEVVEEYIGSAIEPRAVTERHDRVGVIVLRSSRVVSLTSVTDGTGVAVTGYMLEDAGIITSGFTWYGSRQRVTVTYLAGFAAIPAAIRLAVLYVVQHAYEAQQGAVPVQFQSGADETFVVSRGFALPNRAKEYLEPYRRGTRVG